MASNLMRECPFDGCGMAIDPSIFACPPHWGRLSYQQKRTIYDCYGKWKSGAIDGDELRRIQQTVLDEVQGRKLF